MAGVPNDIPGIGSVKQTPRPNPAFDPTTQGGLTSEDYYVFSRIDGASSLYDLILSTGLGTDKTIAILTKLREAGALLLPGDGQQKRSPASTFATGSGSTPATADSSSASISGDLVGPTEPGESEVMPLELTAAEQAAMSETVDLAEHERRRVIRFMRKVEEGDLFALLGVSVDADKKTLKRAYFRLSKEFHPDRHYGKSAGSFGPWLAKIFQAANKAFEVLADDAERARHLAGLEGQTEAARPAQTQTPAEHAKQLFEHACAHELKGDLDAALNYFAAAIRVDPRARHLRRAANVACQAKHFDIAEEYAKQAVEIKPADPSYTRVLAKVYFAAGNFEAAEDTLVSALLMKTENDTLAAELEQDLDRIRRALVGV